MKSRTPVVAVLLAALCVGPQLANAAVPTAPGAFGSGSARIDHPYWRFSAGESAAYAGTGVNRGDLQLDEALTTETVDGVECLVVQKSLFGSRWNDTTGLVDLYVAQQSYWLAQDTSGSVWLLQFTDWDGTIYEYWRTAYVLDLPASLADGDRWRDAEGNQVEVVSLTSSLTQLPNGLGPYGGVAKLRVRYAAGGDAEVFLAPGVGRVFAAGLVDGLDADWERVPTGAPEPGPGVIQFSQEEYSGNEGQDWFRVTLARSGGSEGVVWALREVTDSEAATNPGTFFNDPRAVFFAPGQTSLAVDVRLNDDDFWSHQRTMTIALSEPGGGAALGERTSATVVVQDDESGEDPGSFIGPCFLETLRLR